MKFWQASFVHYTEVTVGELVYGITRWISFYSICIIYITQLSVAIWKLVMHNITLTL